MEPQLYKSPHLQSWWSLGNSTVGCSCLRAEQAPGGEDVALPQWDPQPSQTLSSLTGGLADAAS